MTARAYSRCTSGHYFVGEYCPFDGWSSKSSKELYAAAKRLENAGKELTLDNLKQVGASKNTIERTVIIQFGSEFSTFDAIAPADLVVNGETVELRNLDESFT